MTLSVERPLNENGRGGQVYLPADFVRQFCSPIAPGDDVVVQIVPHEAIVLLPERPEYPTDLPLRSPDNYP